MANFSSINYVFAALFTVFGALMCIIGFSVLSAGPSNDTEWTIALMSLVAAAFLFYGAWQTVQGTRKKAEAETKEAARLNQKYGALKTVQNPTTNTLQKVAHTKNVAQPEVLEDAIQPEILVRWTYSKNQWKLILQKLAAKTKKEERYTAFWFPVFGAIIFWNNMGWAFLGGVILGFLYIEFRIYFVKQKFALKPGMGEAEIIISDSYLRINGNFIHYADGHYYLKDLTQDNDPKLGNYLLFNIGWTTSKGLPAQMDLYLPIAPNNELEAELILLKFKASRL